jgi:phosphatidyl-myo-inositol alpha-mannosyltransferase
VKIAIVTEYYYPLLGGISENVHHTALKLRALGHDVRIVTSHLADDHLPAHEMPEAAAEIIRIGRSVPLYGNGSRARLTVGLRVWHEIRTMLKRERFDIVHVHNPLFFTLPPIAGMAASCPTVGTFHSCFDHSRIYDLFKGVLQKQVLNRIDTKTVVAPSVIHSLREYFTFDARVIPNGIDVEQFCPDAPRIDAFDRSKMTLLFLGRFDPRNGLPLMLQAFEIVKRRFPDVRLVVVGDGSLRAYYQSLVAPAVKPDVHFVGPALGNRPRYYATCDVFCSPISKASFGITLLEAMAVGRPIVATTNEGYRELLGPEEGVLVPEYDAKLFADAIVELLNDERRRGDMGRAGLLKAQR